mmetsp:Transcript_30434/g.79164  ORF Transcript_30434/g.79164 Transcript_30434/m.79164 type:complete len:317 (-) Transcript_30434:556-1506(-)
MHSCSHGLLVSRAARSSNLLGLALAQHCQSHMGSLLAAHEHSTEGGAHPRRTINLSQLHACQNHPRYDLASVLHNAVLCCVHVQSTHSWDVRHHAHGSQALHTCSTHGAIMPTRGHHNLGLNNVGVHAALQAVVQGHKSPVCHYTSDVLATWHIGVRLHNQILSSCGVEQLDIGSLQNLRQQSAGELGCMLDHHVISLILVGHIQVVKQSMGRLTHNHATEQLATQPGTTTRSHTSFNDGDLHIRGNPGELVGARQASRASSHDDHVRLGILVQVCEVSAGHGAGHLRDKCSWSLKAVVFDSWTHTIVNGQIRSTN